MSLDQNLMGLGLPGPLAQRIASGGTGPIAVTPKGSSYATSQLIGGKQFVTFVSGAATAAWVGLPVVGGDSGPDFCDDFTIHNGNTGTLTVGIPAGVTVNIGGSASTGNFTIAGLKTASLWVISTTQWMGLTSA
jgi:hypothetical protein